MLKRMLETLQHGGGHALTSSLRSADLANYTTLEAIGKKNKKFKLAFTQ